MDRKNSISAGEILARLSNNLDKVKLVTAITDIKDPQLVEEIKKYFALKTEVTKLKDDMEAKELVMKDKLGKTIAPKLKEASDALFRIEGTIYKFSEISKTSVSYSDLYTMLLSKVNKQIQDMMATMKEELSKVSSYFKFEEIGEETDPKTIKKIMKEEKGSKIQAKERIPFKVGQEVYYQGAPATILEVNSPDEIIVQTYGADGPEGQENTDVNELVAMQPKKGTLTLADLHRDEVFPIWVVTSPKETSTVQDIVFRIDTLEGFLRQFKGGLKAEEIAALYSDDNAENAKAFGESLIRMLKVESAKIKSKITDQQIIDALDKVKLEIAATGVEMMRTSDVIRKVADIVGADFFEIADRVRSLGIQQGWKFTPNAFAAKQSKDWVYQTVESFRELMWDLKKGEGNIPSEFASEMEMMLDEAGLKDTEWGQKYYALDNQLEADQQEFDKKKKAYINGMIILITSIMKGLNAGTIGGSKKTAGGGPDAEHEKEQMEAFQIAVDMLVEGKTKQTVLDELKSHSFDISEDKLNSIIEEAEVEATESIKKTSKKVLKVEAGAWDTIKELWNKLSGYLSSFISSLTDSADEMETLVEEAQEEVGGQAVEASLKGIF